MSDNPLDRIPKHDRVSLRAVVVRNGDDPGPALAAAGITEPIALPIMFGEAGADIRFGDGMTPNLIAVLEPDQAEDDEGALPGGQNSAKAVDDRAGGTTVPAPDSGTTILPAAYGLQPLAPVRRTGQSE